MNRLMRIANPVIVFALICAFIYIYFVYMRGAAPPSLTAPSAEAEKAGDGVSPEAPDMAALSGPVVQQQNPIVQPQNPVNLLNQPNLVQQPNQLEAPQGNPNSILPAQPNQNVPLQPIAVPFKTLQEGHWIGMEVIPLTAAIAQANSIYSPLIKWTQEMFIFSFSGFKVLL